MYEVKIYKDGSSYLEKTDKWDAYHICFTTMSLETACFKQSLYLEQHQQVWDTIYYLEKQYEKTHNPELLKKAINTLKSWLVSND